MDKHDDEPVWMHDFYPSAEDRERCQCGHERDHHSHYPASKERYRGR